jgi:lauroyl/myristoyl acyltransferase/mitochondrial fission protein ELM1
MMGGLLYYFDFKHKAIAYSNIKTVFKDRLSPSEISNLTKEFYRTFGQNFIDIFLIPLIDKEYINKYIIIEGLDYIAEAFKRGKGIVFLGVHAGSWELSNIICAKLGLPYSLFIRDQRHPRLDKLLNSYRNQKGCRIIQRQNQTQQLIQALKNNESIGITADQGGKTGTLVKFFGKYASMPSGAVRLALKYDATLLPAYYMRIKGPYIKLIIEPPFKIKRSGDKDKDVHDNLQELIHIFEKYILKYPQEYLWSYKIWKYTKEKNILILSDGKTGHLRQAQALSKIVSNCLRDKGITTKVDTVEVRFKNRFSRYALNFSSLLSGKHHCQGCLWCLRAFLKEDTYKHLTGIKPDIVISCGSSIAPINFIVSRENLAKSIVIMRPSILSTKRFDLVIMPEHDRPARRKNVTVTQGALNLIDEGYLKEQSDRLCQLSVVSRQLSDFCIGLLIGGDTKNFQLKGDIMLEVIKQIKYISERFNADILVTTSRRTSKEIEHLVKEEFKNYPHCKLLIIANEKNIPEAVGGILGLSQIIVTSPESISMISEAVNSKKYVLVFSSSGLGIRHHRLLNNFTKNKYIYLIRAFELSKAVGDIWLNRPKIHTLRDNIIVSDAIKRIL